MSDTILARQVWKFGDSIDTDLMLPGSHLWRSPEERARVVFQANRPGWVDKVQQGDAIVAGINFGCGSSRPAAFSLKTCGIGLVVAESVNGLFFRNAVNFGLLTFECPGVAAAFEEGDSLELSIKDWTVRNPRTGATLKVQPVPELPLSIMLSGGVIPLLEKQGYIAAKAG
jgi:3-isopropylmalate/(R)-2-methylmalate dehydratase small subunit